MIKGVFSSGPRRGFKRLRSISISSFKNIFFLLRACLKWQPIPYVVHHYIENNLVEDNIENRVAFGTHTNCSLTSTEGQGYITEDLWEALKVSSEI